MGVKATVAQRRGWLRSARGNKNRPVTQSLTHIAAFYHPDIDELSTQDPYALKLARLPDEWEDKQPTVRAWIGEVLQHRHYKSERVAARGQGDHKADDASESDWGKEYEQAYHNGGWSAVDPLTLNPGKGWNVNNPMPDKLYLGVIKTLLADEPEAYLATLKTSDPLLHKVIHRQLFEHARYHLFWAHTDVYDASAGPATPSVQRYTRLVPVLHRVVSACRTDSVTLDDCRRCIPMSQISLLLDYVHSGSAHLRDSHETLQQNWCGVPRKAIRLFAAKCHVCTRVNKKQRNKKPPRVIEADYVRQRYTLDLIDMKQWQLRARWGSAARSVRYVAHMIDHSSKYRWATAIADKTAGAVQMFVRSVFTNSGQPALLHTDNGTEFANTLLEEECREWGVRIIHGRPYHPQSQGVVERANGAVQTAMKKIQASNPQQTDWVLILARATVALNNQVSSVTRQRPDQHFRKHDNRSRDVRPIPADEPVVITVTQLKDLPALSWVKETAAAPYDLRDPDGDGSEAHAMMDGAAAGQDGGGVEQKGAVGGGQEDGADELMDEHAEGVTAEQKMEAESQAEPAELDEPATHLPVSTVGGVASEPQEEGDIDEDGVPPQPVTVAQLWTAPMEPMEPAAPVAPCSSQSSTSSPSCPTPVTAPKPITKPRRQPTSTPSPTADFDMLTTGEVGALNGTEWDDDHAMGLIPQHLRRVGTIGNGDCGPAAAYYTLHGRAATARQAAQMRADVYKYATSPLGEVYYADHRLGELSQAPEDLPVVLELIKAERRWVTTEFMTLFGGMANLNVFVLVRTTDVERTVSVGIQLVTNGRVLVRSDKEDCVCVYFQHDHNTQVGHFEAVVDNQGRRRWRADDEIVMSVLWRAMDKKRIAVSVRDARNKQLVAAHNRINTTNETFTVGDLAWLTLPPAAAQAVVHKISKAKWWKNKHVADDGKMLVKIGRIHSDVAAGASQSSLPVQSFVLYTVDGRIEGSFSIDHLTRCYPPPEATVYATVNCEVGPDKLDKKESSKSLTMMYRKYLTLLSLRIEAQRKRTQAAAATQPAIDLAHIATLTASSTVTQSSPSPPPPPEPSPIFPCTFCEEEVTGATLSHCMNVCCHAPFHTPGTGCRLGHRVHVVDTWLLYCTTRCATDDNRRVARRTAGS